MEIKSVFCNAYAVVETNVGEFRVWQNGAIDMWIPENLMNPESGNWGYFPEFEFDVNDVAAIRKQAFVSMRDNKS